jgi:hypothetical protein
MSHYGADIVNDYTYDISYLFIYIISTYPSFLLLFSFHATIFPLNNNIMSMTAIRETRGRRVQALPDNIETSIHPISKSKRGVGTRPGIFHPLSTDY